jgi:hypothetical protein
LKDPDAALAAKIVAGNRTPRSQEEEAKIVAGAISGISPHRAWWASNFRYLQLDRKAEECCKRTIEGEGESFPRIRAAG